MNTQRIGWITAFLIISTLVLSGCAITGPDATLGPCAWKSLSQADALEKDYPVRIGHGTHQGKAHQWCEYKDPDKGWLLAKDTIWYNNPGWPIEDYETYEVNWYGYKNCDGDTENEYYLYNLGILKRYYIYDSYEGNIKEM